MALAKEYPNLAVQEVDGMEKSSGYMKNLGMSSSCHENPNGNFVFRNHPTYQPGHYHQVSQSLINFKCGIDNVIHKSNESLLSFEPDGLSPNAFHWDHQRLLEDPNCFHTASNYNSITSPSKENKTGDGSVYDWLYSEATVVSDAIEEAETYEADNQKRPHMGETSPGVSKKQCTAAAKKQKHKSITGKDPQSIAAKNRRERISERLKILQELVPNGSKVDLVTMLEKAISYVKFLQLQVKILATDEFWPVQGGKAPDISQVREAIDAILSSQRERSSSSNSRK